MRINRQITFSQNSLIKLKDQNWLDKQRVAGKIVAETLKLLEKAVQEKTNLSMLELNRIAEEYIESNDCQCTFKGYRGFPAGVCISVNNVLVHGIPNDYKLQEGDKVSFDLGATYAGVIADSAITCVFGEGSPHLIKMINDTREALSKSIQAISISKKLGCIGDTIYKYLKNNYNVIENYGGHGICMDNDGCGIPHAAPFVANRANPDDGVHLVAGMTLAIEPMALPKSCATKTSVANDGWSVLTDGIGCHWEETIFIHEDHVEIITQK